MISPYVPIIEQLDACRTDAERARWLLRCPHGELGKYEFIIRVRLRLAGFLPGVAYLEEERAAIWKEREDDGSLSDEAADMVRSARARMMAIARGAP